MTLALWRITVVALMLASAGRSLHATERMPVPDITLVDRHGAARQAPAVARAGTWLLVVAEPGCTSCDVMLDAATAAASEAGGGVIVVLAGGAAADIEAASQRWPALAETSWFLADRTTVTEVFRLTTRGAIVGVRDGTVEWSLSGVITNPADLRTLCGAWLATPP